MAYKNKETYNRDNPLFIGQVGFWLEEKNITENKELFLMYNVNPDNWNKNNVIMDLEMTEKYILEKPRIV